MSTRVTRWFAWSLLVLAVALSIGVIPLDIAVMGAASSPGTALPAGVVIELKLPVLGRIETFADIMAALAFSSLGAVIVSRYPANTVGWIFCAYGFLSVVESLANYYAVYGLFFAPGTLPGGLLVGWLQNWVWVVSSALLSSVLPLLFPTGRLLSQRWRPAWWLAISATVALALGAAFHPGSLFNGLEGFDVANPFGVTSLGELPFLLSTVPFGLLLASMLLAAASLIVRLRHARGEERRQIKWFGYFGAVLAGLFALQGVVRYMLGISTPSFELPFILGWSVAGVCLPVATGLAILRYRLFDIDVLIRRTLVYGTLTVLLAGVYFGVVIGAQAVVQALTGQKGQQPVLLVATTLLTAALFNPLRRAVQATIDRHFYRRKYDAQQTLAAFSATLRQEVELTQVCERLLQVVQETMQPSQVWLWLRAPARATATAPPPVHRTTAWQHEEPAAVSRRSARHTSRA
jgi:hypothetical protein